MKGKYKCWFPTILCLLTLVIIPKATLFGQCEQTILADISSVTTSSATLKIIDNNENPELWQYEIGISGFITDGIEDGFSTIQEFSIDGLNSGTAYDIYLRTICAEMDTSSWNGPFQFFTIIDNNNACFLDLSIPDNSCGESNVFPIEVSGFGSNLLGEQIFISDVSLIVSHSFPEDLSLTLISPSGQSVLLSANNGLGLSNYGNPELMNCSEPISFSDQACEIIDENTSSLIGGFRPDENLSKFDGEQADGIWMLKVCDKNLGDVGTLNFLNIELTTITCPVPTQMYFDQIHADSVVIEWPQIVNCLNIVINYGPCGFVPGTGNTQTVNCLQEGFTITGLNPETCYDIYLSTVCSNSDSPFSCQFSFETSCENISYQTDFDEETFCSNACNDICPLSNEWTNLIDDDIDWLSYNGISPTEFTGPLRDFKGNGNYLYIENQNQFCPSGSVATLESSCLQFFSNEDDCDFSFAYHMFGADITYLEVQISTDGKSTWNTLILLNEEQSDTWERVIISLDPYQGETGFIRFISESGQGSFGDIAIDDITFYGTVYNPDADKFYIDADLDGFGDIESDTFYFCVPTAPLGFSPSRTDCDDTNADIHPDALEINCNAIDENCNGLINEEGAQGMITISNIEVTPSTCDGSMDGAISIDIEGGISPFTFDWNPVNTNSSNIAGLITGSYDCIIEDASGCQTAVNNIHVGVDQALSYQLENIKDVTCLDTDNGSIEISVEGGSGDYIYSWNSGSSNSPSISGLSVGIYVCTITDILGCEIVTDSFNVVEAEIFSAFIDSIKHLSCFEDQSGYLRVNTTGISPVERIEWSNGAIDVSEISNLESNTYGVTVSSSDGCQSSVDLIVITQPDELQFSFEAIEDVICFGGSDGSVDIVITGGTLPYEINWNNGDTTEDISNLSSGFYFANITDDNGCDINTNSVLVSEFSPIELAIDSINHVECPGSLDGFLEIQASGGGGEYEYFWNNVNFADNNKIENAPAGIYTVTVVDRFGCKSMVTNFEIEELDEPIQLFFTIVDPNACHGDETADIIIQANDFNPPLEFNWSNGIKHISGDGIDSLTNLRSGEYRVTVTDGEGCTGISSDIFISEPDELSFVTIIKDVSCLGSKDGEISLFVSGGTEDYTYAWSNGESTSKITDLDGGNYFCIIRDENGCLISTQNINVEEPKLIKVDLNSLAIEIDSFNLSIDIEGGNPPYQCDWNGEQTIVENFCEAYVRGDGEISLHIQDQNFCVFDTSFILSFETNSSDLANEQQSVLRTNLVNSRELHLLKSGIENLKLYDLNGRLVFNEALHNQNTIPIPYLSSGIYVLVASNATRLYSEKIMIIN